jgi:hypothetical protein
MNEFILYGGFLLTCFTPVVWLIMYFIIRKHKWPRIVFRITLALYLLMVAVTAAGFFTIHDLGAFIFLMMACAVILGFSFLALLIFILWKLVIKRQQRAEV